jgi:hypothetical protein
VADELDVNLVALHVGSTHALSAIGDAALDFVSHEDGLADAAPGWVGSSQLALGQPEDISLLPDIGEALQRNGG